MTPARSAAYLTIRRVKIEQAYIEALTKLHSKAVGADLLQDEYVIADCAACWPLTPSQCTASPCTRHIFGAQGVV